VTIVLLVVSFVLLLAGAIIFTNAVEWAGARMNLGSGAVGSILAAVATALPESLIPAVAIIGGTHGSQEVAIGAVIGAPFLLATLAMALVGISSHAFQARRDQDDELKIHVPTTKRDLTYFLSVFAVVVILGLIDSSSLKMGAAVVLVLVYAFYVYRSVIAGGAVASEEGLDALYFDTTKKDPPSTLQITAQIALSIVLIIVGAHFFVEEVTIVAESIGISALVLSLVLAPLATELPEKVNSFIWVREGKDALAVGNITGAMVFQSTIPAAIGLAFTSWNLNSPAVLASACALAGGAFALWALTIRRKFTGPTITVWLVLFFAFVIYSVTESLL
jgi:cation:H+ antiporter